MYHVPGSVNNAWSPYFVLSHSPELLALRRYRKGAEARKACLEPLSGAWPMYQSSLPRAVY